jgi:DNA-binding beta-propeller fold protein YncE
LPLKITHSWGVPFLNNIAVFPYNFHYLAEKMMKANRLLISVCFAISVFSCKGQKTFGNEQLVLKQSITLPAVNGRIDHLDCNLKDQIIYLAALSGNSLEVIDLKNGKVLHSVKGLNEPQGVAYIPQTKEVIVANGGNGTCVFYNSQTFEITAKVDLGSDADDVRYDSLAEKIYVGYGDGGLAIIDARTHKQVGGVKLPAHPEGFQIDQGVNKVFVNVPGAGEIDVINLKNMNLTDTWKTEYHANFPMAIDPVDHIIFIGYRRPAKLIALNATTGETIAEADMVSDIDDLYYDERSKKLYASGGGGAINVFNFTNSKLTKMANIPTKGGARTSLLISSLDIFCLAEKADSKPAQLQVFTIHNE